MKKQYYFRELKTQIQLTIPIVLAQIFMTAMGFVDMVMTGYVSAMDMAAVALGSSIWVPLILFFQGILQALHPVISQWRGEGYTEHIGHVLRQGIWLATFLSLPLFFIAYILSFQMGKLGLEEQLADLSGQYLRAIAWGTPGFLYFVVIRCYFEGMAFMRPSMIGGFIGLLFNVPLNYIFIFGKCGLHALGGVGSGFATGIVYWVMFFVIFCYAMTLPDVRRFLSFKNWVEWIDKKTQWQLLRIGFPGALGVFFEVTSFAIIALLVAPLGVTIIAGHEIALNFSALLFMIPFSLAITATIRTGYSIGRHSYEMLHCVSFVSLSLGLFIALCSIIFILTLRYEIAGIYNNDVEVLKVATSLMIFTAINQCFEALQAITMGIIKGYKDTKTVFYITLFAYWFFAIPVGYILGRTNWFVEPMGVTGFWLALLGGLSLAGVLGLWRVTILEHKFYKKVSKGL